jgi:linoleoyl-CoA desaturase
MKFENGNNSQFYNSLSTKVDNYFIERGISKKGNVQLWIKAFIFLSIFIFLYINIIVFQPSLPYLIGSAILFELISVFIFFNFVHDASHRSLSQKKQVNKLFCYLGDIVGVNTYIWHIRHDRQHHTFTNVPGGDVIMEAIPLIRLNPHQKHLPIHRYQLFYAPILYGLYSLYWIFIMDFFLFFKKDICTLKNIQHPRAEWIKLILFKIFYLSYMLAIPIILLPYNWKNIVFCFLVMHLFAGMLMSVISVLGHNLEGPEFPVPLPSGNIQNSWGEHELETCADFATDSKLICWITGGLNAHVCHHLFPTICHVHYYNLTPLIRKHCNDNGYKLIEYSLPAALISHIRYLKSLSK